MIRTPASLIPYIVMVCAVAGGLLWQAQQLSPGQIVTQGEASVGGPFALIDQNGTRRTDADFHGRFMLVYFGYTHCPDVCPTTLAVMAQALSKLGRDADRIVPVFITVDPARDTPTPLKNYVASFGPRFIGLTGPLPAIKNVAREYRVYFANVPDGHGEYSVDHSSYIYLMGPDGKFIALYEETIGPGGLAKTLREKL